MLGYAFVLISFPAELTQWTLPSDVSGHHIGFMESFQMIFTGHTPNDLGLDQITGATPLDQVKTALTQGTPVFASLDSANFNDNQIPYGWASINIAFLVGGLWMLYSRAIRWQYPVGFLGALAGIAFVFHSLDPSQYAPVSFHLLSGGVMLAAFSSSLIRSPPAPRRWAVSFTPSASVYWCTLSVTGALIRTASLSRS